MPQHDARIFTALLIAFSAVFAGCRETRENSGPPTFDQGVSAILASRCTTCHGDEANGWKATSYLGAIACVDGGAPAVLPADDTSPLARALSDATHASVMPAEERATVLSWVRAGAPKFSASVHDPSFVDPRSDRSHGRMLRAERWRPMLDATSEQACGRCHEGTPSGRPEKVSASAPGATACTTCHADPKGPLACNTCHGAGQESAPPRDPCFFPDDVARAGAHTAHVLAGPARSEGLACETCHTMPGDRVLEGSHGNGVVDVVLKGEGAAYDRAARACTTSCHARPGATRPTPAWSDKGPLGCSGCHGAPPPQHYEGACDTCHREADAKGAALSATPKLHVNGKVDLGDGSGKCGACHGNGDDPSPKSGAHASHLTPSIGAKVACETCHVVPTTSGQGTNHPTGGPAKVALSGLATNRGAAASYAGGACSNVYCHGANVVGTTAKTPSWTDTSGASKKCDGCHGTPPGAPHIAATTCSNCHGSVVDPGPSGTFVIIRPDLHVNGGLDR